MMDAVLKLGNANDIINRGWELRNLFFATQNSKLMFGGAVSLGGMATDPIGCGVLNELGKLPGDHLEIGTGWEEVFFLGRVGVLWKSR